MVDIIFPGDDRPAGPILIAREVQDIVEENRDAEIVGDLASVQVEHNQFGGFQFEIAIHQSNVNSVFEFNAMTAERQPIGDVTSKATDIEELNDDIATLANVMEIAYDTNEWEFAELEAQSIGGTGGLTDYVFTYQTGTNKDNFTNRDLEDAIEQVTM